MTGGNSYSYDANGNMTSRKGDTITWTSYNYPSEIIDGTRSYEYSYGADRQKWKQVYDNGSTAETTYFAGRFFEKNLNASDTDHINLEQSSLIHMNGQVLDAEIGRIMSPDPFVFHSMNTQGFNRYAYTRNNPMRYTDPSGFNDREVVEDDEIEEIRTWGNRSDGRAPTNYDLYGTGGAMPHVSVGEGGEVIEEIVVIEKRWALGDPLPQGLVDLVAGFGDAFLIPELVRDAFGIDGGIDPCSANYRGGKVTGFVWGAVPFTGRTAAAVGGTRFGHVLNHNRYLRLGPGRMPGGTHVPRASIGRGPGNPHINLRGGAYVPPIGGPTTSSDCGREQ